MTLNELKSNKKLRRHLVVFFGVIFSSKLNSANLESVLLFCRLRPRKFFSSLFFCVDLRRNHIIFLK